MVSAAAGRAAYDTIVSAVAARAARRGRGHRDRARSASWRSPLAGLPWKGHTDLLAHLCGTRAGARCCSIAAGSDRRRWPPCTCRSPTCRALLTRERLEDTIALTAEWLPRVGVDRPRIAVAGLNPHAGERGVLGSEDEAVLRPAVAAARARGIDASGPWPADTVFLRASRGEFDAVVACYHDQGLIPVKLLGVRRGGQRHDRPADRPHLGRSRHRLRHRRHRASPIPAA